MRKRYGVVYVNRENHDLKDLRRVPKKSYAWLKRVYPQQRRCDVTLPWRVGRCMPARQPLTEWIKDRRNDGEVSAISRGK